MTVTPLPLPIPVVPGSAPASMGPDAEASAQSFAALVTQMLAGQGTPQAEVPALPGAAADESTTAGLPTNGTALALVVGGARSTDDAPADPIADGEATTDPKEQAQPTLPQTTLPQLGFLSALPIPSVVAALTATTVETGTEAPVVAGVNTETTGGPTTATAPAGPVTPFAGVPTAQGPTAETTAPNAPGAVQATATSTVPSASPAPEGTTPAPSTQTPAAATTIDAAAGTTVVSPVVSAAAPATGSKTPDRDADAATQPTPATTAPTGVGSSQAAPSVAGPTATASAPATTPAAAVTRQVFPEVTRLVSAGNGTHRVRLQLEPEALGEVRVFLTVRNGEVHVRLAGGEDAQRALRQGAPELHRLLELAGASDTRIVVRDLSSGSAPGNGSNTNLTGQWSGGSGRGDSGVGQGGDRSQHQHAGTRGGSNAREGTNDGAGPHRPVQPVTRTRLSGVDVTM